MLVRLSSGRGDEFGETLANGVSGYWTAAVGVREAVTVFPGFTREIKGIGKFEGINLIIAARLQSSSMKQREKRE